MPNKVLGSIVLPIKPAMAATGAVVQVIQEPADEETAESFFGGYAEGGLLDDMGFDAVAEAPAQAVAARKS